MWNLWSRGGIVLVADPSSIVIRNAVRNAQPASEDTVQPYGRAAAAKEIAATVSAH